MALEAIDSTQRYFDPTVSQGELAGVGTLFTHGLEAYTQLVLLPLIECEGSHFPRLSGVFSGAWLVLGPLDELVQFVGELVCFGRVAIALGASAFFLLAGRDVQPDGTTLVVFVVPVAFQAAGVIEQIVFGIKLVAGKRRDVRMHAVLER
ncbi:hypothetical protein D3C85_1333700 [compost metagenome]